MRYYMFIPLTWAATIGMLYPELRDRFPRVAVGLLGLVLVLFGYMVDRERDLLPDRAVWIPGCRGRVGRSKWWPKLEQGKTYCVVDMSPIGIMMTGPDDARIRHRGPNEGLALSRRRHDRHCGWHPMSRSCSVPLDHATGRRPAAAIRPSRAAASRHARAGGPRPADPARRPRRPPRGVAARTAR